MIASQCPHCGGNAYYICEDNSIALRCWSCGYLKFLVYENKEGMTIEHREKLPKNKQIPRRGSKLWRCLIYIVDHYPVRSRAVADDNRWTMSDTGTMITVLRLRGLVTTRNKKKGKRGGSIWVLTKDCEKMFFR